MDTRVRKFKKPSKQIRIKPKHLCRNAPGYLTYHSENGRYSITVDSFDAKNRPYNGRVINNTVSVDMPVGYWFRRQDGKVYIDIIRFWPKYVVHAIYRVVTTASSAMTDRLICKTHRMYQAKV